MVLIVGYALIRRGTNYGFCTSVLVLVVVVVEFISWRSSWSLIPPEKSFQFCLTVSSAQYSSVTRPLVSFPGLIYNILYNFKEKSVILLL